MEHAFVLLKKHGFWMRRKKWLNEKNHHDQFYKERKHLLILLKQMVIDLSDFEERSYKLKDHQIDGKGHESQAETVSQQYMREYEQIQENYAKLLPVMIAILTPQTAKFEVKFIPPKKSR